MAGWPATTLLRGEVVYTDGHVTGAAGRGRVVSRRPGVGKVPAA